MPGDRAPAMHVKLYLLSDRGAPLGRGVALRRLTH
jgi:hypothetical protein